MRDLRLLIVIILSLCHALFLWNMNKTVFYTTVKKNLCFIFDSSSNLKYLMYVSPMYVKFIRYWNGMQDYLRFFRNSFCFLQPIILNSFKRVHPAATAAEFSRGFLLAELQVEEYFWISIAFYTITVLCPQVCIPGGYLGDLN